MSKPRYPIPVYCLDPVTGIEIARYPNISEAARVTGINRASIQHVLAGRYITAGGYKWNKG